MSAEPVTDAQDTDRTAEVDRLLIQSIGRWGLITAALLIVFDTLVLLGYPFPGSMETARRIVYTVAAVILLSAVAWITFLGYRLVTLRVATARRQVYPVFLPITVLFASIIGFLLMTVPK